MSQALHVVILAAGEGKRMNSSLPKVLMPLAGKPLLRHVVDTARALKPAWIHVVYGHGGDKVLAAFDGAEDIAWVHQGAPLGTGHAMIQAMPSLPENAQVLVLYGDVPLLSVETVRVLLAATGGKRLAVLVDKVADPRGYGRVIVDPGGNVLAIVEEKDATTKQRAIDLINTGVIAASAGDLRRWLVQIGNRKDRKSVV